MSVLRVARPITSVATRGMVAVRTRAWKPGSHLFVVGDRSGWSIDDDVVHVAAAARRLGCETAPSEWAEHTRNQAVFLPSHFTALTPRWLGSSHRIGCAYFHGRPGTPGHPEFDSAFDTLRRNATRLDRVQVTHAEMHELVVAAGVDPGRVFRIPIGIDVELFPQADAAARAMARSALGLPSDAFVVGSFQKDGTGWGDGDQPKPVKGPDVLVASLAQVRARVSDLVVLLLGPARGYVRRELERHDVVHRHAQVASRDGLAQAYHALDAYLVASRQEGGPKSALEALATGVPLVSTRVGQVPNVVADGVTGLLAEVGDAETLAGLVVRLHDDPALARALSIAGRDVAESYAYPRLDDRWAALFAGFVEVGSPA